MANELTAVSDSVMIEKVVVGGDLSPLSPAERLNYYKAVCESLGLNPYTKPFDYIRLNNRLVLYAKRDATDQLRNNRKVSVTIVSREKVDDVYVVTAKATMPDGRIDESIGAVNVASLKGEALANAMMKAETKAKRRVTLSIVGLGWLDETEIETIPDAKVDMINVETGEVTPPDKPKQEQPKANGGNGHGKKPVHPSVVFWKEVEKLKIDRDAAAKILAGAGNDYEVALDRLTGVNQEPPPVEEAQAVEENEIPF